jgi:hypothetical protein
MSAQDQVPSNIAEIIDNKRQALFVERQRKAEAELRDREEHEVIGRSKHIEYIQDALSRVPEFLRQYEVPSGDEPDFYRIGKGWERPSDWLYFEIPGLAKILFAPNAKESPWKCQTASPYEQRYDFDGDVIHVEPSLNFSDRQYGWTDDLDYALGCAHAELQKYQEYVAEYAAKQEEIAREVEQREVLAKAREAKEAFLATQREQEQAQEKAEEQALFEAIKSDPVALNMLKAFILIRDERSSFQTQLENADWSLYNMEERHSRRAEELRRLADEADRRAADERSRLQSDLDDAEAKLKKVQRGW